MTDQDLQTEINNLIAKNELIMLELSETKRLVAELKNEVDRVLSLDKE